MKVLPKENDKEENEEGETVAFQSKTHGGKINSLVTSIKWVKATEVSASDIMVLKRQQEKVLKKEKILTIFLYVIRP